VGTERRIENNGGGFSKGDHPWWMSMDVDDLMSVGTKFLKNLNISVDFHPAHGIKHFRS
jgi:hypothetical protein